MQSQLEDEEKLQQAAIRLREFKELASAEKKGRQVQITTKLPPAKRTKWGDSSWGSGPSKPKSLIEKARVQSKKTSTMYRGSGASMARVGGGIGGGGSSSSSSTTSSTSGSRSPQVARSSSLFIPKPKPKPTAPISSPSAPTRVSPNKAHNILLQDHLALASGESSSSSSTASSSPGALRALGSSNVGNGHGGGDQHINHPTLQRFTAVSTTNADPTRPLSSSFPSASSARISISSLSSSKKQPYFNVGKPSLSWPH
ncbi:hypothetical protein FRB98_003027 [Tulasnella sp. 332]|nr:hypothetical protein FRB98_003027 [Tulasnella sp. 332]